MRRLGVQCSNVYWIVCEDWLDHNRSYGNVRSQMELLAIYHL